MVEYEQRNNSLHKAMNEGTVCLSKIFTFYRTALQKKTVCGHNHI